MSVNFYKRFPGDYMRDTAHLSLAEHGVYSVLLDAYYATESPLPLHREAVYRMARATTTDDRLAVDSVLKQFWKEQPNGWHNTRANEEIRKYNNQREANTQVAHDREAKKRKVKAAQPQTGNSSSRRDWGESHSGRPMTAAERHKRGMEVARKVIAETQAAETQAKETMFGED